MVLEALLRNFSTGLPWELLYADDLVLIAESMEDVVVKFKRWKDGMESGGLRVNVDKTKVMVSGVGCGAVVVSGLVLCARKVCM